MTEPIRKFSLNDTVLIDQVVQDGHVLKVEDETIQAEIMRQLAAKGFGNKRIRERLNLGSQVVYRIAEKYGIELPYLDKENEAHWTVGYYESRKERKGRANRSRTPQE